MFNCIKLVFCAFLLLSHSSNGLAQDIYSKAYGKDTNPAIVFIHGGPGHDSQNFEISTAQELADAGFYVVVYDQRGQGRSAVATDPSIYNYKTYADDLNGIITTYKLKNPVLMGHSHGGPIALKFDQFYPGVAKSILLVSAPIDFWPSLQSIQTNCANKYNVAKNEAALNQLNMIFAALNGTTLDLVQEIQNTALAFQHGMQCGLYQPSQPTPESVALNQKVAQGYVKVAQENIFYPMGNFIIYEKYTRLNETAYVKANAARIFGIYGKDDGLFTPALFESIESTLVENPSANRFQLIENSSHNIFIDQQEQFINAVKAAVGN